MRNFGLTELVLVAPHADPLDAEARRLSTHGEAILHTARSVPDLGDALADCVLTAATSARTGGLFRGQSVGTPRQVLPKLAAANASGPVALVFGPESSGLTSAEVSRCHWLITIPAVEDYPVLNLAQAVAVCCYELFQATGPEPVAAEIAPFALQERTFVLLEGALRELGYLQEPKADALMHALRHLIGRAGPSPMEANLLIGLARQIAWVMGQRGTGP
jgi:tRNA/rRNA methyltransferase